MWQTFVLFICNVHVTVFHFSIKVYDLWILFDLTFSNLKMCKGFKKYFSARLLIISDTEYLASGFINITSCYETMRWRKLWLSNKTKLHTVLRSILHPPLIHKILHFVQVTTRNSCTYITEKVVCNGTIERNLYI